MGTEVKCDTMSGIIRGLNGGEDPPILHFWSLDCEGCENVALETLDWNKTEVAVLIIEMWEGKNCGGNTTECQRILSSHGMRFWGSLGREGNQIWYSERYFAQPGRNM